MPRFLAHRTKQLEMVLDITSLFEYDFVFSYSQRETRNKKMIDSTNNTIRLYFKYKLMIYQFILQVLRKSKERRGTRLTVKRGSSRARTGALFAVCWPLNRERGYLRRR